MLRSLKVATPEATATVSVPLSVPGMTPPLWPIATVTLPTKSAVVLPNVSWTVTPTGGVMLAVGGVLLGCPVNASCTAAPGVTVTPAACVMAVPPAVGLRVHEVSVAIPSAPVLTDVVGVTAPLPAAGVNVTATLATGFPFASFTITDGGGLTAVPAGAEVPPPLPAIVAAAPAVSV